MKKHILSIILVATIATQSQPMQRFGINRAQAHVGAAIGAALLPRVLPGVRHFCQTPIVREQSNNRDFMFILPAEVLDPASKLPAIQRINLAGKNILTTAKQALPKKEVMDRIEAMKAKHFAHMAQEMRTKQLAEAELTPHFMPILENMPLADLKEFTSLYQHTEELISRSNSGIAAFMNVFETVIAQSNPQDIEYLKNVNIAAHPDLATLQLQVMEVLPWLIFDDKEVIFKVLTDKLNKEKK